MVKAYLRYELSDTWGVVASDANVLYDASGKFLIAAALENVALWNVKQGTLHKKLVPPTSSSGRPPAAVTALALDARGNQLAAGHADGAVRLWDLATHQCLVTLSGHKSAVTVLVYDGDGALLASGGRDTDIVVWDSVAETGLYRLRGHKGQVTGLAFVPTRGLLLSAAKDGYLKAWALDTQHCCQTIPAGGGGELWALAVDAGASLVVAGGTGAELGLWEVGAGQDERRGGGDGGASTSGGGPLQPRGSVRRGSGERVGGLGFVGVGAEEGEQLLWCQGAGKVVEVFRIRSDADALRHVKRRRKRRKEKGGKAAADGAPPAEGGQGEEGEGWAATDKLASAQLLHCKGKVRSVAAAAGDGRRGVLCRLALARTNNSVEEWLVSESGAEKGQALEMGGHRAGVRCLALSSDDSVLVSASSDSLKVWNPRTGACLRTVPCGYGLCALFAPGNRHCVLGTKGGALELYDVAAGAPAGTGGVPNAHSAQVWSLAPLPDGSGFVSGGDDQDVKFWEWAVVAADEAAGGGAGRSLALTHTRTLKMPDNVLAVRVSGDGKLIAVALLDATIRVFFADSLKFYLSLYGHKLPALALDISSDGQLLASGGSDKNLRIWGLDFGDCHRSLFAHGDSVMGLQFVPRTHYAFTVGKDRVVKYWDCDKFELLLELQGHCAEVWALAVSQTGEFVVSAGHDRSLRRWERTDEPFFVEEERERRLESLFEADAEAADGRGAGALSGASGGGEDEGEAGSGSGAAPAERRTLESLGAADALVEALEVATHEEARIQEHDAAAAAGKAGDAPPLLAPNPLMLGLAPSAYLLRALQGIKAAQMEQALLLLPFPDALRLLRYIAGWLEAGPAPELCVRTAALLLRIHAAQLTATPAAYGTLATLQRLMSARLQGIKDTLGYNMAALTYLQRAAKERQGLDADTTARPVKRTLAEVA